MFSKYSVLAICVLLVGSFAACSTNSFLPVHQYGDPSSNGTALGQRTVSDPHAFAPGTQRSWMEVCQRKVVKNVNNTIWDEITYHEPCTLVAEQPGTNFVTFSPYVNGLATPLIQAGAIVGASAILADGIRDSASRTTNNNGNTNSSGSSASNSNSNSNSNTNANVNGNVNSATGGAGGNGGRGGNGGNGGGHNPPGCGHNSPYGC